MNDGVNSADEAIPQLTTDRATELAQKLIIRAIREFFWKPLKGRYQVYLRSPRWQSIRLQALRRDEYLCQKCKKEKATQVHHLTYENCGKEELEDLISLCQFCHSTVVPVHFKEKPPTINYVVRGAAADYLVQNLGLTYEEVRTILSNDKLSLDSRIWFDTGDYK